MSCPWPAVVTPAPSAGPRFLVHQHGSWTQDRSPKPARQPPQFHVLHYSDTGWQYIIDIGNQVYTRTKLDSKDKYTMLVLTMLILYLSIVSIVVGQCWYWLFLLPLNQQKPCWDAVVSTPNSCSCSWDVNYPCLVTYGDLTLAIEATQGKQRPMMHIPCRQLDSHSSAWRGTSLDGYTHWVVDNPFKSN